MVNQSSDNEGDGSNTKITLMEKNLIKSKNARSNEQGTVNSMPTVALESSNYKTTLQFQLPSVRDNVRLRSDLFAESV